MGEKPPVSQARIDLTVYIMYLKALQILYWRTPMCTCAKEFPKKVALLTRLAGKITNIENGRFVGFYKVKNAGKGRAYHKTYKVPFDYCPVCGERYPAAQQSLFDQIRQNTPSTSRLEKP